MSSSTVGLVKGDFTQDVFGAARTIKDGIRRLAKPNLTKGTRLEQNRGRAIDIEICGDHYMRFSFWDGDNSRLLYVFFTCDGDHEQVMPGRKLCMSIGDNDRGTEIIRGLLDQFPAYDRAYIPTTLLDGFELIPAAAPKS